jgi:GNAT superfamily N-acetyltransferase
MSLSAAIETFARGFAFTRSFTHPYLAERVGPLWALRDGPCVRSDYRAQEWVAADTPPAEVVRIVKANAAGRYAICHIRGEGEDDTAIRAEYKRLGYRLRNTEPMFVHDLHRVPRFEMPATIERVRTPALADRLAKAAKSRQILPEYLEAGDSAPIRQYAALDDHEAIIGWVRSIVVGRSTWVSNMFVEPAHRRRGIGSALLAKMLRDDRAAGAECSTLLASHAGAKLYPRVGYRSIGELLLYSPVKPAPK